MPVTAVPVTGDRYLNLREAAEELAVSPRTVRRLIDRGELLGFRIGTNGQLRVPLSSIEALLRPVPPRPKEHA